jgi:hypothetical protein
LKIRSATGSSEPLVDPHRTVVAAADVQAEGHVGGEAFDHAAVELDGAVEKLAGVEPLSDDRVLARPVVE